MRLRAHIHRSNGKWWCFWGYFVGLGHTPEQAWADCNKHRSKFNVSMGLRHDPEATKHQLHCNLWCPVQTQRSPETTSVTALLHPSCP